MKTWRIAGIPEEVRERLRKRLETHIDREWKGRYHLHLRFRGVYAYIDVYPIASSEMEEGEEQTAIETERIRLCRIEYMGSPEEWGFAFYKYSDSRYALCVLPNGSFTGSPEEAFDCAANVYLHEW